MESVKESFVLNWSWFHLPQRTVHTWVTWLPLLHIPSWAYWVCMHVCVCTFRMGAFPWFHRSAVRMCLSEEEFGNVFLKQMRGKIGGKKREGMGQWAFSDGFRMLSTWCGGIFIMLTLKFLVCVYWSDIKCREKKWWFRVRGKKSRREHRSLCSCWSFHSSPVITDIINE